MVMIWVAQKHQDRGKVCYLPKLAVSFFLTCMTYLTCLHRNEAVPHIEYRRVQETSDKATGD